jgi:UPF0755 protein
MRWPPGKSDLKIIVPAVIIILVIAGIYEIFYAPHTFYGKAEVIITIPRGIPFHAAVDSLRSAGLIDRGTSLLIAGHLLGWTHSIQTGKYLFRSGVSTMEILSDLHEGRSRLIFNVTIPEGSRTTSIAGLFERQLGTDYERFLSVCTDTEFIRSLGVDAKTLEGYLFPETYNFYWESDEYEIIARLVEEFKRFYNDTLQMRTAEMHLSTNEVLTMASIIEWEAILDTDRPTIAGLYYNRIRKQMKLEADPTIRYLLNTDRRILYRDLMINSPYNTYRYFGLPPAPINNPGRKSILAALYPAQHQYLYFVANGMQGHVFSKSYTEHQRAVQKYRRFRMRQEISRRHQ